jgi:hypothetical protein
LQRLTAGHQRLYSCAQRKPPQSGGRQAGAVDESPLAVKAALDGWPARMLPTQAFLVEAAS